MNNKLKSVVRPFVVSTFLLPATSQESTAPARERKCEMICGSAASAADAPDSMAASRRKIFKYLAAALFSVCTGLPSSAAAKTFIDYFQPTPTACPVTSKTWGVSGVLPRDTCNGLENTNVPPQYYYWDGKIIPSPDGKYYLFADRWAGSTGFGNWGNSQTIYAVSDTLLGPYTDKGYAFNNGPNAQDPHKGHNASACVLPDGTYCLYVNEIVPFTIFTSTSLAGPWTPCANPTGELIQNNGVTVNFVSGGDMHMDSNVSLVVRPDGNFEVIQRHGVLALSTTGICGPYKVQQSSNTYPSNQQPPSGLPSIYPNRQKHASDDTYAPSSLESTYVLAEDPVIWYSGGQYHVLYDYPDDRVGYHLTSTDGIHNWTDQGFAFDPRMSKQLFSTTDGTVNNWFKMERPGVIMENGHITHFTFAVSDVDKNNQITAGSNHGSKVLVMAFDGVTFDSETGIGGDGGAGGSSGTGGRGSIDGGAAGSGSGGTSGSGGMRSDAGTTGAGGSVGTGGSSATGGTSSSSAGGAMANGGNSGRGGSPATGGSGAVAGSSGSGGMASGTGGTGGANVGPRGGATSQGGATSANGGSSGCSCVLAGVRGTGNASIFCTATLFGLLAIARRRIRPRCGKKSK
jgi:hypothetical protein